MAIILPSINSSLGNMTNGERRFAERLAQKLDDDYLCWFNVPIGSDYSTRYPDFIIYHPHRGILILEVKDWKLENIAEFNRSYVLLKSLDSGKELINPLEQARKYMRQIAALLKEESGLLNDKNQLIVPYACGVVLTNISRNQYETHLAGVMPDHLVICQDEMYESVDDEAFQKSLWDIFPNGNQIEGGLTSEETDRIRLALFPELRATKQVDLFDEYADELFEDSSSNLIKVMDLQQEQLARSLGEGHRIIHGVAGSGKTMILKYRAEYLAQFVKKPILILCYNRPLADSLSAHIEYRQLSEKVEVKSFHQWSRAQLVHHNLELPPANKDQNQFFKEMVERVEAALEAGIIPTEQYAAVLIDEGHDFEPEWFKIALQMLDSADNSLLVLYDDAQSIYGTEKKKVKTFSSVGINARGRTSILRINYRNTYEILRSAEAVVSEFLIEADTDEDNVPLLKPESAGVHGDAPLIMHYNDQNQAAKKIVDLLIEQRNQGFRWGEMAIICRYRFLVNQIRKICEFKSVPIGELSDQNRVRIVTMHASKGLEFPCVIIPSAGIDYQYNGEIEEEARLLYVAMTRATQYLALTYSDQSIFYDKLCS